MKWIRVYQKINKRYKCREVCKPHPLPLLYKWRGKFDRNHYFSNRWLTTILISNKKAIKDIYESLAHDNIECRPLWKPMHLQPVFADAPYYGEDICENLFNSGLCLPSGSNLSEKELFRVVNQINTVMCDLSLTQKI